jgi:hypothetical protein
MSGPQIALPSLGLQQGGIVKGHRPVKPAVVDQMLEYHFTHGWTYKAVSLLPGMPKSACISQ